MRYANRQEAGRATAAELLKHQPLTAAARPLVLALPRGGVPVGYEIATVLQAELDLVVARKIGLPWQPELALGATTCAGPPYLDYELLDRVGLSADEIAGDISAAQKEACRRLNLYRGSRPPAEIAGRTVIVTDDGLATGATARAALRAIRKQQPDQLVLAVPVAAVDSLTAIRDEADAIICPQIVAELVAIGLWYDDFHQLTDQDVLSFLAHAQR